MMIFGTMSWLWLFNEFAGSAELFWPADVPYLDL